MGFSRVYNFFKIYFQMCADISHFNENEKKKNKSYTHLEFMKGIQGFYTRLEKCH